MSLENAALCIPGRQGKYNPVQIFHDDHNPSMIVNEEKRDLFGRFYQFRRRYFFLCPKTRNCNFQKRFDSFPKSGYYWQEFSQKKKQDEDTKNVFPNSGRSNPFSKHNLEVHAQSCINGYSIRLVLKMFRGDTLP